MYNQRYQPFRNLMKLVGFFFVNSSKNLLRETRYVLGFELSRNWILADPKSDQKTAVMIRFPIPTKSKELDQNTGLRFAVCSAGTATIIQIGHFPYAHAPRFTRACNDGGNATNVIEITCRNRSKREHYGYDIVRTRVADFQPTTLFPNATCLH